MIIFEVFTSIIFPKIICLLNKQVLFLQKKKKKNYQILLIKKKSNITISMLISIILWLNNTIKLKKQKTGEQFHSSNNLGTTD